MLPPAGTSAVAPSVNPLRLLSRSWNAIFAPFHAAPRAMYLVACWGAEEDDSLALLGPLTKTSRAWALWRRVLFSPAVSALAAVAACPGRAGARQAALEGLLRLASTRSVKNSAGFMRACEAATDDPHWSVREAAMFAVAALAEETRTDAALSAVTLRFAAGRL